jgi:hypothetical protein
MDGSLLRTMRILGCSIREDSEAMMENHRELLKKYRKKKR